MRMSGRLGGIGTTGNEYVFANSDASVSAVPVMPANFSYMRK